MGMLKYAFISAAFLSFACQPTPAPSDPESSATTVRAELQNAARTYDIQIEVASAGFSLRTTHGAIDGKAASSGEIDRYSKLFLSEFTRYPKSLVTRTKLKAVVLCTELTFAGQRRGAIPNFENDTLYLDVNRGSYAESYQRAGMHHEFFHIVDWRDDGQLYRDDRWAALNPGGFKYGSGGKNAQNIPTTSLLTERFPGFLNHYSTTGVEEDKAELFAYLMTQPKVVEQRANSDPVLKAKVVRMKELVHDFCPEADEAFWPMPRGR